MLKIYFSGYEIDAKMLDLIKSVRSANYVIDAH